MQFIHCISFSFVKSIIPERKSSINLLQAASASFLELLVDLVDLEDLEAPEKWCWRQRVV